MTALGHVHLKVRNLERSVAFYREALGLEVSERVLNSVVFLSGTDAHHELALQEVGPEAEASAPGAVGLYHTAWEVPDRQALARAYERLAGAGVPVNAVDHGISWALYFWDPDDNGVEIYLDRRAEPGGSPEWRGRSRPLSERDIVGRDEGGNEEPEG